MRTMSTQRFCFLVCLINCLAKMRTFWQYLSWTTATTLLEGRTATSRSSRVCSPTTPTCSISMVTTSQPAASLIIRALLSSLPLITFLLLLELSL